MSGREPGILPVALYVNGAAVSTLNPLPATGGGGGGGGGDVLAVALRTASSTATVGVSINWFEE